METYRNQWEKNIDQNCHSNFRCLLSVIFLEAVCVEGYSTLLAHEDRLVVLAALLSALLAVAAFGMASIADLGSTDPLVETIQPDVRRNRAWPPPELRGRAMSGEHVDDQLPQEVQEGLLLPCHLHAHPPGIHSTDAEAPCVDRKPPLLDSIWHPVDSHQVVQQIHSAHP